MPPSLRALVVDESHLARWALGHALTHAGFAVEVAATAESALEALSRLQDLDILVASLSQGREAVERLTNEVALRWPGAAVILLATDVDAPAQPGTEGQAVVLDTPFSVDDVVEVATQLVPAGGRLTAST